MKPIAAQLDKELCEHICGWHRFEQQNKVDIIDMALSIKVMGKDYNSRDEVLKDIEGFLALSEIKTHDLIRRKLAAHHYFLRMTMGEDIPFDEYFGNVMGFKSVLFTPDKLKGIQANLSKALEPAGLHLHPDIDAELAKTFPMLPDDQMSGYMAKCHEDFFASIKGPLQLSDDFNLKYSWLPESNTFRAWISGDGRTYQVKLNAARVRKSPSYILKALAIHELSAHAVHFTQLRRQVDEKKMPKYMGYVSVHEPAQFAIEGLATTLRVFRKDGQNSSIEDQIDFANDRLYYAASHNAMMLTAQGADFEECVKMLMTDGYLEERLARLILNDVMNAKPMSHGYRQVYGAALETFYQIAATHPDPDSFLKNIYHNLCMPDEIIAQTKRPIGEFI